MNRIHGDKATMMLLKSSKMTTASERPCQAFLQTSDFSVNHVICLFIFSFLDIQCLTLTLLINEVTAFVSGGYDGFWIRSPGKVLDLHSFKDFSI